MVSTESLSVQETEDPSRLPCPETVSNAAEEAAADALTVECSEGAMGTDRGDASGPRVFGRCVWSLAMTVLCLTAWCGRRRCQEG